MRLTRTVLVALTCLSLAGPAAAQKRTAAQSQPEAAAPGASVNDHGR